VRSPLDGIVIGVASEPGDSLRPRQSGDPVQAGETLFSVARSRRFIVRTKVDEQDIAGVRVGQRAIVSGEDFAGRQLSGRVADISPAAVRSDDPSNTSRQILTTIALDRTLPFLRDGMSVDVDIVTSDEPNVLSVPLDALRRDAAGHAFIYIVRAGKAERADVTLGTQSDTAAVVKSGLHPGDIVVADRNPDVTASRAVRPGPSPSPASSGAPAGP
jgi:RND family efflux transporter MFP subunit